MKTYGSKHFDYNLLRKLINKLPEIMDENEISDYVALVGNFKAQYAPGI